MSSSHRRLSAKRIARLAAVLLPAAALFLLQFPPSRAIQPPDCMAEFLRVEAKLFKCLAKEQAKAIKEGLATPDIDKVRKCHEKFFKKADKLQTKLGCPDDGDIDAAREQTTLFYVDQTRELAANPCATLGTGCYLRGALGQSCNDACAAAFMTFDAAGTQAINQNDACRVVHALLMGGSPTTSGCSYIGDNGCFTTDPLTTTPCTSVGSTGAASDPGRYRYCACQ